MQQKPDLDKFFFGFDSNEKSSKEENQNISFIRHLLFVFFQHVSEYICVLDKDFRVLAFNKGFERKTCFFTNDPISFGYNFLDLITVDKRDIWEEKLKKTRNGEELIIEEEM